MSIDTELLNIVRSLEARIRSLERVELPVAGSGGFAPSSASYITVTANASLAQERVATAGNGITLADGGANSILTIATVLGKILIYRAGAVIAFDKTTAGLVAAFAAAVAGDEVFVPAGVYGDFATNWVIPYSITVTGAGNASVFNGSTGTYLVGNITFTGSEADNTLIQNFAFNLKRTPSVVSAGISFGGAFYLYLRNIEIIDETNGAEKYTLRSTSTGLIICDECRISMYDTSGIDQPYIARTAAGSEIWLINTGILCKKSNVPVEPFYAGSVIRTHGLYYLESTGVRSTVPVPYAGDQSTYNITTYAAQHASDIAAGALLRHLPAPGNANYKIRDNGTNWISEAPGALTRVDDTNVTLTLGGSPTVALLAATSLTLGWSGQLSIARGGTGASTLAGAGIVTGSLTSGKAVYATGATTIATNAQIDIATSGSIVTITASAATDTMLKVVMAASHSGTPWGVYDSSGNLVTWSTPTGEFISAGTASDIQSFRFNNAATFSAVRINGSIGSETGVLSGNTIGVLRFRSFISGTYPAYTLVSAGGFNAIAAEDHTSGNVGTRIICTTTSIGSGTALTRTVWTPAGNFVVGSITEAGTTANRVLMITTGAAPTSQPADAFQLYSKDRAAVAGQAWPHVQTEDSTTGYLGITVAEVNLTDQSAAIAATTLYAVPAGAGGVYVVHWVATVTTAATTSSVLGGTNGMQVKYTDGNDSVVKTAPGTATAGVNTNATNSTATGTITGCYTVFAKASTNIQYLIDYTSVGATAMKFNLHLVCRRLT